MPSKKPKTDSPLKSKRGNKTLVIVESPTKARTIGSFLGQNYQVEASMGHVRDLPSSRIGIDTENNFEPTYLVPKKAKDIVKNLKTLAADSSAVILATDEDREGESIAWHLLSALKLPELKLPVSRIAFHEITKSAIENALQNPRQIEMNMVDAQQGRRILDRLVGYSLSPFLWRKVRYGLSAGRVQSVALRLIVEREKEIKGFQPKEYWSIEGDFLSSGKKKFKAKLHSLDNKALEKFSITTDSQAQEILENARNQEYEIKEVAVKEVGRNPASPFTTSTLQQEASRKLGYSAKQTMIAAQRLYEQGFITYMRTDSMNLAESALLQAKDVISERYGKEYSLPAPRRYQTKSKGAQEAHEAIRPTDMRRFPEDQRFSELSQRKIYELIWKRTMASQMASAVAEQTSADIASKKGDLIFRASGLRFVFDGFMRAYTEGRDEEIEEDSEKILPELTKGSPVEISHIESLQHFTEPPARYTDATLVKTMEAHGIGRPSTYAPTLSTIQERGYVKKEDKKYFPTEEGELVNSLLVEHFPEIVDLNFTAKIESELDEIAEGKMNWREVMREFYTPFKKHLDEKEAEVEKQVEISQTPCPHCKEPMIIKFGRMGKFLACPQGEKVTLPMPEEQAQIDILKEKTKDERCPLCGAEMTVRRGRFGFFLGCSKYPECKGISKIWNKTGFKCPKCKTGDVVEKKGRGRSKPFWGCNRYPDCEFLMNKKPESEADLLEALNKPPSVKKKATGNKKPNLKN
jgi:DNA topoisomerase I